MHMATHRWSKTHFSPKVECCHKNDYQFRELFLEPSSHFVSQQLESWAVSSCLYQDMKG